MQPHTPLPLAGLLITQHQHGPAESPLEAESPFVAAHLHLMAAPSLQPNTSSHLLHQSSTLDPLLHQQAGHLLPWPSPAGAAGRSAQARHLLPLSSPGASSLCRRAAAPCTALVNHPQLHLSSPCSLAPPHYSNSEPHLQQISLHRSAARPRQQPLGQPPAAGQRRQSRPPHPRSERSPGRAQAASSEFS